MFERPQLTVVDFEIRDILTASGNTTDPSDVTDPTLPTVPDL
jgi:hypothetical protein